MPITKSAKKALRQSQKRHLVNLRLKRRLKAALKEVSHQANGKTIAAAYKVIDLAKKHHLIHPNKARRLKSKVGRQLKPTTPKTKAKAKTNKKPVAKK